MLQEKPMRSIRFVALVALMVAGAVTRPTAVDGVCGFMWVGGEAGQSASGWSWVEAYPAGYCWYGQAAAWVGVSAPGGGYNEDDDYGFGVRRDLVSRVLRIARFLS